MDYVPKKRQFNISIQDFSGGMNYLDAPHAMATNQWRGYNWDIVGVGQLQKRYGYTKVCSAGTGGIRGLLTFYKTGSSAATFLCIFSADGHLYTITPSSSTPTDQGAFGTDGGRVNGAVFNNLAIFGNGLAANVVKKFDGTTLGTLGGSPVDAKYFTVHARHLFLTGVIASPSNIYWSDTDDPEDWSTGVADNIPVALQDGQNITGFKIHNDQMIVFKEYSKYGLNEVLDATTDAVLSFTQKGIVDNSDGALAGNSIVSSFDGFYFYGEKGFQKFGQQENYPDRRVPSSLSDLITPIVKKINLAYADQMTAIFGIEDPKYYCASPINGSRTNNYVFILNKRFPTNPWQNYQGLNVSDFEIFEDSTGKREVYFGDELSNQVSKFNDRFIDNYDTTAGTGNAIQAYWRSKTFIPSYKNWFRRVLIRGAMTKPCTIKVTLHVDGSSATFNVTESEIQWITNEHDVIGYDVVGHTSIFGLDDSSSDNTQMYTFLAEIHFPSTIKTGREFYIEIESNNINEGIRLDWIDVEGEKESSEIIK